MEHSAYLVLENGAVFPGEQFGATVETVGEVVFTTGMTGYLETLTDPSYYGQMVVQTFPLIGNYGIIPEDFESDKPQVKGYIVGEWCHAPSNFRQEGSLDAFLKLNDIPGICGLDTRGLVKIIREKGVMQGKLAYSREGMASCIQEAKAFSIQNAVASVSPARIQTFIPQEEKHHVVLWDFGAKRNIQRELLARGCRVTSMPCSSTAAEIMAQKPDGVMLSNGPGDPAENTEIIRQLSLLLKSGIPVFGICLGHQLLALARGAKTEKLHYGHRGANQPVRDTQTGRVYITSQNHGYAVTADSLPQCGTERYINANDGTCEGVDYTDIPAFSVQFHPEGCGGPRDTRFLFDRFVQMMEVK